MGNVHKHLFLTTHVRERYLQRTSKRYVHLENCCDESCSRCEQLKAELRMLAKQSEIEDEIKTSIDSAKDEKSFLNNQKFMSWYFEKYGYDKRFKFLVDPKVDLLYVVVVEKGREVVVTCVKARNHWIGRAVCQRHKFKKKVG